MNSLNTLLPDLAVLGPTAAGRSCNAVFSFLLARMNAKARGRNVQACQDSKKFVCRIVR